MTIVYNTIDEFAQKVGLKHGTLSAYRAQGRLPQPDAIIGRVQGWTDETINTWKNNRPGQGARTDLKNKNK